MGAFTYLETIDNNMKHTLYISLTILITSCASRRELIPPPGTVKLNDTTYIDRYPITNFEYLEFLNSVSAYWSLRTSDSLSQLKPYGLSHGYLCIESPQMIATTGKIKNKIPHDIFAKPFYGFPDSVLYQKMNIKDTVLFGKVSSRTYLTHPAYRDYPVLNIDPIQAETYCKWRTDMVKIYNACNNKDSLDYSKHVQIIHYRLPKKEEWIQAQEKANLNYLNHADTLFKGTEPVVDIYFYSDNKNSFPFYSYPGRLSEIIDSSQIINYGWTDSLENKIEFVRPFVRSSPGIGFRCSCEVKK